jgi:hypothetical protein
MGFFRILAAIPGFFISSLILMLLWDAVAPRIGLAVTDINYPTAMLVTITLWLAVAPLAAAAGRGRNQRPPATGGV